MIPSPPQNLIPRPFSRNGNHTIIPDNAGSPGRASYAAGFPVETQRPLREGGVAPNRLDFNGLGFIFSSFLHWIQSGGQFSYNTTLNYTKPNIVFHNENMWWCLKENGPDSVNGLKEPGTDEEYWLEYLQALLQMTEGNTSLGNPVGTVISFWGTTAPEGYYACDGTPFSATENPILYSILRSAITPDLRGYFIRGYDTRSDVDPDGDSRDIGNVQQDAMQKMTGTFNATTQGAGNGGTSGVFTHRTIGAGDTGNQSNEFIKYTLDSSSMVRTADETRPKNVNLLWCIKHD